MKFLEMIRSQPKSWLRLEIFVLVLIIGSADFVLPWEFNLFIFYLVPILLAAWYVDRRSQQWLRTAGRNCLGLREPQKPALHPPRLPLDGVQSPRFPGSRRRGGLGDAQGARDNGRPRLPPLSARVSSRNRSFAWRKASRCASDRICTTASASNSPRSIAPSLASSRISPPIRPTTSRPPRLSSAN